MYNVFVSVSNPFSLVVRTVVHSIQTRFRADDLPCPCPEPLVLFLPWALEAARSFDFFPERATGTPAMSTTTEAAKSGAAAPVRCQRIGCDAVFTDDDNPEGSCQYHPSVSSSSASSDLPSPPKTLVPGQDHYESHHCFKSQIDGGWHLLACPEYVHRPLQFSS